MPYRNTGLCQYTCHDLYTHGLYGQLFAAHWHSWECKGVLKTVDQFLETLNTWEKHLRLPHFGARTVFNL